MLATMPSFDVVMSNVSIDDETGCWLWTGRQTDKGYGEFWWCGCYRFLAHRLVYPFFEGESIRGLELHHECDNYICVNPAHLSPLTRRQHALVHSSQDWN